MLRTMSWEQFKEWQQFDRLEPIGDHRSDWQAASICSMMANLAIVKTKSTKRFQPKDFVLEFTDEPRAVTEAETTTPRQTGHEMKWIARMYAAAYNAQEAAATKRKRKR